MISNKVNPQKLFTNNILRVFEPSQAAPKTANVIPKTQQATVQSLTYYNGFLDFKITPIHHRLDQTQEGEPVLPHPLPSS